MDDSKVRRPNNDTHTLCKGPVINYRERWGATKRYRGGGGGCKSSFAPKKREDVLAMLKGGGGTTSFGVAFTQELEVLAILEGGAKFFHPLKK